MGVGRCSDCGGTVSDRADRCPHCGNPLVARFTATGPPAPPPGRRPRRRWVLPTVMGVLSVGLLGAVVVGTIVTGNWPFGGDQSSSTTTAAPGGHLPLPTGHVVMAALQVATGDPALDWSDPAWDPGGGLVVQLDDGTTVGFADGSVVVTADGDGDGLALPVAPVVVTGDVQQGEDGPVFVPAEGLGLDDQAWMEGTLEDLGATPLGDGPNWEVPEAALPPAGILDLPPADDWEDWAAQAEAAIAADPALADDFAALPPLGGGLQPSPNGTPILARPVEVEFCYFLPGPDHLWVICDDAAVLFIPTTDGEMEATGVLQWQPSDDESQGQSGSIAAVFDPIPGPYRGTLSVSSEDVVGRLPGVTGTGSGPDWRARLKVEHALWSDVWRRCEGSECVRVIDCSEHDCGIEEVEAKRQDRCGKIGLLGGFDPLGLGRKACEGIGSVADRSLRVGSKVIDAGNRAVGSGVDALVSAAEQGVDVGTEVADAVVEASAAVGSEMVEAAEAYLQVMTGDWMCPQLGGLELPHLYEGPGSSTVPAAYAGVVQTAGLGDLAHLVQAWFPTVRYSRFEPAGRLLRVTARVFGYDEAGREIPQSLLAADLALAARLEIVYTLFFESDCGRSGFAGHAGDNEGFVVGLVRSDRACRGSGFVFDSAESHGHKPTDLPGVDVSFDRMEAAEIGACPGEDWSIGVSEGKHAIYFHEEECEPHLAWLEECDWSRVYENLGSRVELVIENQDLLCDDLGLVYWWKPGDGGSTRTPASEGYPGAAWPPPTDTYAGGESLVSLLGGLDTRQVSFWCQTRGKSLCADAADKYHIGGGVFAGASCEPLEALTVPDLAGLLRRDAEAMLSQAGFAECTTAACTGDQWLYVGLAGAADPAELGKVADQDPAPGTQVPASMGVPGVRFWIGAPLVPSVVGLSAAEASAEIARWQLRASQVGTEPTSDSALVGKVVRQSPPAGEMVAIGIPISYWIGTATSGTTDTTGTTSAATVTLKDYTGWSCSAAQADLGALGLVPACEAGLYAPLDSPLVGLVHSHDPAAGTTVARGSSVQLWAFRAATDESTCAQAGGYWYMKSIPCPGGGGECAQLACWTNP